MHSGIGSSIRQVVTRAAAIVASSTLVLSACDDSGDNRHPAQPLIEGAKPGFPGFRWVGVTSSGECPKAGAPWETDAVFRAGGDGSEEGAPVPKRLARYCIYRWDNPK